MRIKEEHEWARSSDCWRHPRRSRDGSLSGACTGGDHGHRQGTITVTSEAALVDTSNTTTQRVLSQEVINAIPSGRLYSDLAAMVPGMKSGAGAVGQTQNTGGALGDTTTNLMIHGSRTVDMRITQNGLPTGTLQAGGGSSCRATTSPEGRRHCLGNRDQAKRQTRLPVPLVLENRARQLQGVGRSRDGSHRHSVGPWKRRRVQEGPLRRWSTYANTRLHTVGQTYGVKKLTTDAPLWSVDGH